MATKNLKSIKFPGLPDTYEIPAGGGGSGGADGYSPIAKVEATSDGAKITITDKTGTTEATVKSGKDGKDGADGTPGADGYSPSVKITKGVGMVRVTITDKDGTTSEAIENGKDGKDGAGMDVTGATAGQIAKISAVDGNGKPTAWIPVDMPSGGGAVSSVNGQTGEVKTSWYFNVDGSVANPTRTQTLEQIVAAQEAGYAPICKAAFSDFQELPATLPALLISSMVCVFGGIGSTGGNAFYLTVMIDANGVLTAKTSDIAEPGDIPTALKNPYALNIKVGNTTTSYDGSSGKTVTIPEAESYTLPVASAATLGGVKPVAKTNAMSQEVGVDENGGLYTEPGEYTLTDADKTEIAEAVIAGGIEAKPGSEAWELIQTISLQADTTFYVLGSLTTYRKIMVLAEEKIASEFSGSTWLGVYDAASNYSPLNPMLNPFNKSYKYVLFEISRDDPFYTFTRFESNNLQVMSPCQIIKKLLPLSVTEPAVGLSFTTETLANLIDGAELKIYGVRA